MIRELFGTIEDGLVEHCLVDLDRQKPWYA